MSNYTNLEDFTESLSAGQLAIIMVSGFNQVESFCEDKNISAPDQPRSKNEKASYINEVEDIDTNFRGDLRRWILINVSEEDNQALVSAFDDYLDALVNKVSAKAGV